MFPVLVRVPVPVHALNLIWFPVLPDFDPETEDKVKLVQVEEKDTTRYAVSRP